MDHTEKEKKTERKEFFIRMNRLMWKLDHNRPKNESTRRSRDRV